MTRTERRERRGTFCRKYAGGCKECGQGRYWKVWHRRKQRRTADELTRDREEIGL